MRKITRTFIALLTVAVLVGCGSAAMAAEGSAPAAEPVVPVQLDGANLTFTDAIPQVKDQRTFLPFRAVFEAMGAEVDYEGMTITAKRGEKHLTMTIGSTDAVVTENGVETPIVMDVAPYIIIVDETTGGGRTYVPVRFAAQAFGCNVGWDQANYTAIIVDTEKLMDEALAGKTFTYMEKFLEYSKKYNTGIWDTNLTFDGTIIMGAPVTFGGTATGTVQGSEKMDMDMTMTMDLAGYMESLYKQAEAAGQPMEPMTAEEQAMLDALAKEGIGMSMRGDMTKGLMYMNLSGSILEQAGMPADTWYSMDMATTYAQLGLDWTELMAMAKDLDYSAIIDMVLREIELSDATTDYVMMKLMVEKVADVLSDKSFVKNGDNVVNTFTYADRDVTVEIMMTLTMKDDKVAGYDIQAVLELREDGVGIMGGVLQASVDEKDQMEVGIYMNMSGVIVLDMGMSGGYTKGVTAPVTTPPAGATVIPYEELMGSAA